MENGKKVINRGPILPFLKNKCKSSSLPMGWKQPLPQTKVKNTLKLGCKISIHPLVIKRGIP
jgi:hypothetical protein